MAHKFNFINFEPEPELIAGAHVFCEEIFDLCPSDAHVTIDFVKNAGEFLCYVRVSSHSVTFQIESKAEDLRSVLLDARTKALSKLSLWHKRRFESEEQPAA
jgi:hypothetical protein